MGRRSEPRIAVSLPVIVRGIDSQGNPFTVHTETHDVSFSGASVKGVPQNVKPGMKVEVESLGRRAWYRIEWADADPFDGISRIGIRSLENGRYIWGIAPKGWEPDPYEPPSPAQTPASFAAMSTVWSGPERRQFARHHCRIEASITTEDGAVRLPGTLSEIGLGGCYIEMLSPLAIESLLRVSFDLEGESLDLSGKVVSSQTGMGMGIAFTAMSPADFEALRKFAPPSPPPARANAQSKAAPPATAASAPPPATSAEALDAIVRLLLRKGLLTRDELAEELEKSKGHRAVIHV